MKILHIDCSPRPESHSRALSGEIVARLLTLTPKATVCRRDLGLKPNPHALADYAAILGSVSGGCGRTQPNAGAASGAGRGLNAVSPARE